MPGHYKMDHSYEKFLNSTGVKKLLKVRKDYQGLNLTVYANIGPNDFRKNTSPLIGKMLDDGIRTVIVDGTDDFICNYQQSENTIIDMKWSGKEAWSKAERTPCKYGLCKEYRNLRQIRVPGSGHGVSIYKSEIALEIIEELMFK